MIDVKVKWGGQMLLFTVSDESNIGYLKQEIYEKTKIKPERQKIIGIKAKDDDIVQEMVYLFTSSNDPHSLNWYARLSWSFGPLSAGCVREFSFE